jgi:hypothetical protein
MVICYKCSAIIHKGHDIHELADVIQQLKKDFNKETEDPKKIVLDLDQTVANMRKRQEEVRQQAKEATSKVEKCFQLLREECDKREKSLVSQIEDIVSQKLAILDQQLNQLRSIQSHLKTQQESATR